MNVVIATTRSMLPAVLFLCSGRACSKTTLLLLILFALLSVRVSADTVDIAPELSPELVTALDSNPVILIRHALAPGTGDPEGFSLDDCQTQRNLSAAGRKQAQQIGQLLSEMPLLPAAVYSSEWCRCRETAELMALAPVKEQPLLNSFFREGDPGGQQTLALAEWIRQQPQRQPLVLITHQVNITALTNVVPKAGELVFLRRQYDQLRLIGTFETR